MKEEFKYSYEALTSEEKKEIEKIRDSYIENANDTKIERIKYLNNKVKKSPITITTIITCIGFSINGLGVMAYIDYNNVLLSIILISLGLLIASLALIQHKAIKKYYKKKYKDEIISLSNEVLK